ncbi:MAG: hypothetical protein Fur0022_20220 [Anaerolineales bacterium]
MLNLQADLDAILENEALTADLDDDAANVLLAWGMSHARLVHHRAVEDPDPEGYAAAQMKATRKWMRAVNRWTPARAEKDTAENAAALAEILALAGVNASPDQQAAFLTAHLAEAPPAFIASLRSFIEGQ